MCVWQLPHSWFRREDTQLNLAFFSNRRKKSARGGNGTAADGDADADGERFGIGPALLHGLGLTSSYQFDANADLVRLSQTLSLFFILN